MAKYTDNFSTGTPGSSPSGWTAQWHGLLSDTEVQNDLTGYGGKSLVFDAASTGRNAISLDSAGNQIDVDILARIKLSKLGDYQGRLYLRGSGTDTSENAYIFEFQDNLIGISKYVNAVSTALGTHSITPDIDTWYYIRFTAVGTALKVRLWEYDEAEPSTWDIDVTDSDISGSGWVGYGVNITYPTYLDAIAVGVGESPALSDLGTLTQKVVMYQVPVEILSEWSPENTLKLSQMAVEILSLPLVVESSGPIIVTIIT